MDNFERHCAIDGIKAGTFFLLAGLILFTIGFLLQPYLAEGFGLWLVLGKMFYGLLTIPVGAIVILRNTQRLKVIPIDKKRPKPKLILIR